MNKKIIAFIVYKNRFLTLRNSDEDPRHGGDFWFTVTGSLKKSEKKKDAVRREIKEETGLNTIKIKPLNFCSVYKWDKKIHKEFAFIVWVDGDSVVLSKEHKESAWSSLNKFIKKIKWATEKEELKNCLHNAFYGKSPFFKKLKIYDMR